MHRFVRLLLSLSLLAVLYTPAAAAEEETFTLNLKNADIDALISTVAKKTGKNFVMDPRVKAKVTVISNQEMNADELYSVFLSVLQVHGYSVVPAGNIIKILPDVNAKQGPVPSAGTGKHLGDELVTQVIPIKNVAASQLVPILRPLVPQQGHLAAYAGSNIIVLTDRASNIRRLTGIINRIDRPDNDEIEFIQLNHASASEVVRILNSLQQKSGKGGGGNAPDAPKLASDDRTNSILVSGSKAGRTRMRALIASLDSPLEQGGNTKVIYLKYAKAKALADILKGVNEGQKKAAKAGNAKAANTASTASKEIDIQADEETNALIITAAPDAMKNIEGVIRQLDIRRAQVHVEAIIAELTDKTARELGFSYVTGNENNSGKTGSINPLGTIGLGNGTGLLGQIGAAIATDTAPTSVPDGVTIGFGSRDSDGNIFGGIMRMIASDGANNILSTPSVVTLDNEEAEIIVGQNVPFVTGSFTTSGNNSSNPFQTIERQDVGIKLKIKPQINEGNTIQLKIEQEVSDAFTDASTQQLITNKRNINTNVLVEDGQLLVLGGLIDEKESKKIAKIPLLGDIPLLGRLFQYRSKTNDKRNLMVFLHPTIIKDRAVADVKSQEKYSYMRAQQLMAGHKGGLMQVNTSILPEIEVYFKETLNADSLPAGVGAVDVLSVPTPAEAVEADAH